MPDVVPLSIPYTPHAGQYLFHHSPQRFKVVVCFLPGQIILGDNKPIEEYRVGDYVFGDVGQLNKVTDIHARDYDDEVITVKARYLLPVTTTKDHKLLVHKIKRNDNSYAKKIGKRKTNVEWRYEHIIETPANGVEDIICSQDKYNKYCFRIPIISGEYEDTDILGVELSPDNLWLMGLYIAEGCRHGTGSCLSLGEHEYDIVKRARKIAECNGWFTSQRTLNGSTRVYIGSGSHKFFKMFGCGAENKNIPEKIFLHSDNDKLIHLLKGYYDGDGSLNKKIGKLSAKTTSIILAEQLQLVNTRLGHPATISETIPNPHILKSDGHLISGNKQYVVEQINPYVIRKIGYKCHDKPVRRFAYKIDDSFYVPITKITKKHYNGKVYNISTDDGKVMISGSIQRQCGRKWGKTTMLIWEAFQWIGVPGALVWWVAPQHSLSTIAWKRILREWSPLTIKVTDRLTIPLIRKVLVKDRIIEFQNGSRMEFKTAENPKSLLGEGVDFMIIDETSRVRKEVWESDLRPNLSDSSHAGYACMASTPQGLNWYYDEWMKGLRGFKRHYDPEYESWYVPFRNMPITGERIHQYYPGGFPTWTNPHWTDMASAVRQAKRAQPTFLQEIAGRFLEDVSFVFKGTGKVIEKGGKYQEARPSGKYFIGADIARTNDYFCAIVVNSDLEVCNMLRYRGRSFRFQVNDLISMAEDYNDARILVDSTGMGEPVYEMIREHYKRVDAMSLTNESKQRIVDNLALTIATKKHSIPEEAGILIEELRNYGSEKTSSGKVRYKAPGNGYDDTVIADSLACWIAMGMGKRKTIGFRFINW